jgi:predicted  nucleic acid-binding Zn-ribbon protein
VQKISGEKARELTNKRSMLQEKIKEVSRELENQSNKYYEIQPLVFKKKEATMDHFKSFATRFLDVAAQLCPNPAHQKEIARLQNINITMSNFMETDKPFIKHLFQIVHRSVMEQRQKHRSEMERMRNVVGKLATEANELQREISKLQRDGHRKEEALTREVDSLDVIVQEAQHALSKAEQKHTRAKKNYQTVADEVALRRNKLAEMEQKTTDTKLELEKQYNDGLFKFWEAVEKIQEHTQGLVEENELLDKVGKKALAAKTKELERLEDQ